MKTTLLIFPLLLVALVPVAFGEIVELKTDKPAYTFNDSEVVVSGAIAEKLKQTHRVALQLFGPTGEHELIGQDASITDLNNLLFLLQSSLKTYCTDFI